MRVCACICFMSCCFISSTEMHSQHTNIPHLNLVLPCMSSISLLLLLSFSLASLHAASLLHQHVFALGGLKFNCCSVVHFQTRRFLHLDCCLESVVICLCAVLSRALLKAKNVWTAVTCLTRQDFWRCLVSQLTRLWDSQKGRFLPCGLPWVCACACFCMSLLYVCLCSLWLYSTLCVCVCV